MKALEVVTVTAAAVLCLLGQVGAAREATGPPVDPRDVVARAKAAGAAHDVAKVESVLRDGLARWPGDPLIESYLGGVLFATSRVDEGYPYLKRVCAAAGFEPSCAVVAGIDMVRGRWDEALRLASAFSETACQKSNRLWALKQIARKPTSGVTAARRLLQAEPDAETSYLFLAAAQWRAGDKAGAKQTLQDGRAYSTRVILLAEPIAW